MESSERDGPEDSPPSDYKSAHETFVSGHHGTTAQEILLLSLGVPTSVLLVGLLKRAVGASSASSLKAALLENLVIAVPLVLAVTCCSDAHWQITAALAACAAALLISLVSSASGGGVRKTSLLDTVVAPAGRFAFVTNYRAGMILTTAVCILAVDFPVYPRRLAKTESFGFGLMDVGVGSFVFAAGMVCQEARRGTQHGKGAAASLLKSARECVPLVALGVARFLSVKASNYHEHVTEYGVHWNFFFTLAATKLFSAVFLVLFPVGWCWALAVSVSICHELALSSRLAQWALDDARPRDSLLEANREGIVSIPGYVAIYLAAVDWGAYLARAKTTLGAQRHIGKDIFIWSTLMWASLFYASQDLQFQPASRRLANWAFFNWMMAYNQSLLLLFLLADQILLYVCELLAAAGGMASGSKAKSSANRPRKAIQKREQPPSSSPAAPNQKAPSQQSAMPHSRYRVSALLEAISSNGLAYFLAANLLTGLVNVTVRTIEVPGCPAVMILLGYILTLNAVFGLLHSKKIKLKAW